MNGLSAKFQAAIAELAELYPNEPDRARHISESVRQALTFVDKHQTREFRHSHLAQLIWPVDPPAQEKTK